MAKIVLFQKNSSIPLSYLPTMITDIYGRWTHIVKCLYANKQIMKWLHQYLQSNYTQSEAQLNLAFLLHIVIYQPKCWAKPS